MLDKNLDKHPSELELSYACFTGLDLSVVGTYLLDDDDQCTVTPQKQPPLLQQQQQQLSQSKLSLWQKLQQRIQQRKYQKPSCFQNPQTCPLPVLQLQAPLQVSQPQNLRSDESIQQKEFWANANQEKKEQLQQPTQQEGQPQQQMLVEQETQPCEEGYGNKHTPSSQDIVETKSIRGIIDLCLHDTIICIYSDTSKRNLLLSSIINLYGEFYLSLDHEATEEFLKKIEQLLTNKTSEEISEIIETAAKCVAENRIICCISYKSQNALLYKILEQSQRNQKDMEVFLLKNASGTSEKPPLLVVQRALEWKIALLQSPEPTQDRPSEEKKYISLFFDKIKSENETRIVCLYYGVITFDKNNMLLRVSTLKEEEEFFVKLCEKFISNAKGSRAKEGTKKGNLLALFEHMQTRMCYTKKTLTSERFNAYFEGISAKTLIMHSLRVLAALDESMPTATDRKEEENNDNRKHKERLKQLDPIGIKALQILKANMPRKSKEKKDYSSYSFADIQKIDRNQHTDLALQLPRLTQKIKLHPYQEQGIKETISVIKQGYGFLLAHDMGLGKTVETLGILEALHIETGYVLIICPAAATNVWQAEAMEKGGYQNHEVQILDGKLTQLIPKGTLIVTYDQLRILLNSPALNPLKTICGYISLQEIGHINLKKAAINKLNKAYRDIGKKLREKIPTLDNIDPDILFKSKEFIDFMKELSDVNDMRHAIRFLCAKSLYNKLVKKGYISSSGMVLKPLNALFSKEQMMLSMFKGWLPSKFRAKLREKLSSAENIDAYLYSLFNSKRTVSIINELFTNCSPLLEKALNPQSFQLSAIVIDEAHELRKEDSQQSEVLLELTSKAAHMPKHIPRIMLTGTPFQNKISEIWSMLNILNQGLLGTVDDFSKPFGIILSNLGKLLMEEAENSNPETIVKQLLNAEKQFLELRSIISSHMSRLRRTSPAVTACKGHMPKKLETTWNWHLSSTQQQQIEKMDMKSLLSACREAGEFFELPQKGEFQSPASKIKGHALLRSYRKILNHPLLETESNLLHNSKMTFAEKKREIERIIRERYNDDIDAFINESGKLRVFVDNVSKILDAKEAHQALCIVDSIPLIAILEIIFDRKKMGHCSYHGSLQPEERTSVIASFNDKQQKRRILFLSEEAGGVAVSCRKVTHVIHYSTGWNPYITLQAEARAFRVDSKHPSIEVVKLLHPTDPCEQKILAMMQNKLRIGDFLIDYDREAIKTEEGQRKEHIQNLLFLIDMAYYAITHEDVVQDKEKIIQYVRKLKKYITGNEDPQIIASAPHVCAEKQQMPPAKQRKTNSGIPLPVVPTSQDQSKTSTLEGSSKKADQQQSVVIDMEMPQQGVLMPQLHPQQQAQVTIHASQGSTVNVFIQQPQPAKQQQVTGYAGRHFSTPQRTLRLTQKQILCTLLLNMRYTPPMFRLKIDRLSPSGHKIINFLNQRGELFEIRIEPARFQHIEPQLRFILIYLAAYATMPDNDPNKVYIRLMLTHNLQLENNEDLDNLIRDIDMAPEALIAIAKMAAVFQNNPGKNIIDYMRDGTSSGISLGIIDGYYLDGFFVKYNTDTGNRLSEENLNYLDTMILSFIAQYSTASCTATASSSCCSTSNAL